LVFKKLINLIKELQESFKVFKPIGYKSKRLLTIEPNYDLFQPTSDPQHEVARYLLAMFDTISDLNEYKYQNNLTFARIISSDLAKTHTTLKKNPKFSFILRLVSNLINV
jgi:hypothetical protein